MRNGSPMSARAGRPHHTATGGPRPAAPAGRLRNGHEVAGDLRGGSTVSGPPLRSAHKQGHPPPPPPPRTEDPSTVAEANHRAEPAAPLAGSWPRQPDQHSTGALAGPHPHWWAHGFVVEIKDEAFEIAGHGGPSRTEAGARRFVAQPPQQNVPSTRRHVFVRHAAWNTRINVCSSQEVCWKARIDPAHRPPEESGNGWLCRPFVASESDVTPASMA